MTDDRSGTLDPERPGTRPAIRNFRDVGSHPTRHGGRVRTGLLYRSVALDRASDEDLDTLAEYDVRTVIDMRTPGEQEHRPDRLPAGAELVSLDVLADSGEADYPAVAAHLQEPELVARALTPADMHHFNLATYRDLVRMDSARVAYRRFFRALVERDGAVLVHCTGGKDRTGWAVAALLLYLGVPDDVVLEDYLVSHTEVQALFAPVMDDFVGRGGDREVIEAMLSARAEFLASAMETVAEDHGSIEAYLRDGLGLDEATLAALRTTFLEPSP